MKSFVQGSEATAARRDQYQRHIFSFTSTNVVQSKCATPICFVMAIFSAVLNGLVLPVHISFICFETTCRLMGDQERDILLRTQILQCKIDFGDV